MTMNHEPWHIVPCTIANCDLRFPSPTRILHYAIDNVVSFVHDCIISGLQCAGQHRRCATQAMTTSVQIIVRRSTSMMTYRLLDGNTTYIFYLSLLLLLLSLSDNGGIIMPMFVLWSTHSHPSCHGRYKRATKAAQSSTKHKAAQSGTKRHNGSPMDHLQNWLFRNLFQHPLNHSGTSSSSRKQDEEEDS